MKLPKKHISEETFVTHWVSTATGGVVNDVSLALFIANLFVCPRLLYLLRINFLPCFLSYYLKKDDKSFSSINLSVL